MWQFFGRAQEGSRDLYNPADRERELWDLVHTLQSEKVHLTEEATYWRSKFMSLVGLGDATYPTPAMMGPAPTQENDVKVTEDFQPLGKHVSIAGLKAKHELASRQKAAEMERERREKKE